MVCIHEKCQIQSIFIYFRIELNCFSVIRYGPAGVTLSVRETLTACASSDCLQKIQKLCAFIWSEGLYDFIPECIDLSEALGSSEFCTVISCAECFKTSIFLFCQQPLLTQSHNNLYPTDVISQSKLSTTLSRRMLLVSRTKKKPALTYSSHFLFPKARWGIQVKTLSLTRHALMFYLRYF